MYRRTEPVHELSLCEGIARTVARHAEGRRVTRVEAHVGYFHQVVPSSLQFCWQFVAQEAGLGACELEVTQVPAVIECRSCGEKTKLEVPVLVCEHCAGRDVVLLSGDEFLVTSITCSKEAC